MLDHDFDDRDVVFLGFAAAQPEALSRSAPVYLSMSRCHGGQIGTCALPINGEHQAASFVDSPASLAIDSESRRSLSQ